MSKSPNSTLNEDVDETMLFDDGFAIVDDISISTGTTEITAPTKKGTKRVAPKKATENSNSNVSKSKEAASKEEKIVHTSSIKDLAEVEMKKQLKVELVDIKKDKITVANSKQREEKIQKVHEPTQSQTSQITVKSVDKLNEAVPSESVELLKEVKPEPIDNMLEKSTQSVKSTDGGKNSGMPDGTDLIKESKKAEENKTEIKVKLEPTSTPVTKNISRRKSACFVWVSNISKLVKASGLKKHFSECGKVNTAKVVTNGKVFFGYVEFELAEHAANCVKKMNNTVLGGKKILVSRTRPDVTKSTPNSIPKRTPKPDPLTLKHVETETVQGKTTPITLTPKTVEENKKVEDINKKRIVGGAKKDLPEQKKVGDDKKKSQEDRGSESKKSSVRDIPIIKSDNDLRLKLNNSKRRMEKIKSDLDQSQIEVRNLRRRLVNEQKRCKSEEMRVEKYRSEARSLAIQIKNVKSDFEKEIHLLNKKHKLELEKAEYHRSHYLKQREELKRQQEDLDREYRKLDEAKKMFEHMKRSRKSRSPSPPPKRFRDRDGMYVNHRSPPPAPKLSSDSRGKVPPHYEEKKLRGVYDRLGDYADKGYSKEVNGRHRGGYPDEVVVQKAPAGWGAPPSDTWKKPNTSATYLKPYMERFGTTSYPPLQLTGSYYPQSSSEYSKHFENTRKY